MLLITNPAIDPDLGKFPGTSGGGPVLQRTLSHSINLILIAGGAMLLFLLLWGGIEYMTAGGDKEATQKATKRITSALVGFVILVSSFAIIYLIGKIFGINLLEFDIPTLL